MQIYQPHGSLVIDIGGGCVCSSYVRMADFATVLGYLIENYIGNYLNERIKFKIFAEKATLGKVKVSYGAKWQSYSDSGSHFALKKKYWGSIFFFFFFLCRGVIKFFYLFNFDFEQWGMRSI